MNKKTIILIIIILTIIISIFIKINYKNKNTGNNKLKSADNILNIESYTAKVTITINSNKTTNTYEAIQNYNKKENVYTQEITSPNEIAGTKFKYDGKILELENTKLNLSKIYENYNYIGNNELSLVAFIDEYNNENNIIEHKEDIDNLILQINIKNNNKYRAIKKLYINKKTGLPKQLDVQDVSKNTLVYILYNEIEINNL